MRNVKKKMEKNGKIPDVLDSGQSIPTILTLSFLNQEPKPKSMSTSTVSPSTTFKIFTLYSYISVFLYIFTITIYNRLTESLKNVIIVVMSGDGDGTILDARPG